MFTTSRRSSVESNQHQGTETPQVKPLPETSRLPSTYVILALGVGLAAYGVYNIYELTTMWPKAIRSDLREGVKYRNQGDLTLSIHYLKKTWEKAKSLPLDLFKPDPLLKISGIAIVLAGVLELDGKKEEAYNVYKEAFWKFQSAYLGLPPDAPPSEMGTETLKLLTGPEGMRAIAIAYKLGCMASELGKPDEEEEEWLTWAVTAILKVVMKVPAGSGEHTKAENLYVMSQDLPLPVWSRVHDLAAPFEALGTFYLKRGNRAYALPLYLQAVSILMPPSPIKASAIDRCRGAELMGKMFWIMLASELPGGGQESIAQAIAGVQAGLGVVIATRQLHPNNELYECELAYMSLLFNIAMMHRLSGDVAKARDSLEASLKQSKAMGLKSTTEDIQETSRELDSESRNRNKDKIA
ncbi:hypothetical protein BYT27DRAFT_7188693 [Phlegmacium glaucopus]|nr:hypothetical protein BYT27DRAFT_7188693 [Phlegmacium glaucopus]